MNMMLVVCVESEENLETRFHFNMSKRELKVGETFVNQESTFKVLSIGVANTTVVEV